MRYSSLILDHVKNPRNVGELPDANARARVRSSADGDMLQLQLRIEGNIIRVARFKVFGCGAAIAAGSVLTELLTGKTTEQAALVNNQQLSELMGGLPSDKVHCSVLAEQAIAEALEDWRNRT
jgi:nitrogen fixation NifU-like protein